MIAVPEIVKLDNGPPFQNAYLKKCALHFVTFCKVKLHSFVLERIQ